MVTNRPVETLASIYIQELVEFHIFITAMAPDSLVSIQKELTWDAHLPCTPLMDPLISVLLIQLQRAVLGMELLDL